jgi:SAM-dependent methyltransferase
LITEHGTSAVGGSFRDREGRVYRCGDRVIRGVSEQALQRFRSLRETKFHARFHAAGSIVDTREVPVSEVPLPESVTARWPGFLEHEPVTTISWPYEWSFGMLQDAALLQLELTAAAVGEGWTCRDATPYNIQFQGSRAVFIDIPSLAPLARGEPWAGYRQFCEMYLFPLMLQAYRGVQLQGLLRGRIDGVHLQDMARLMGGFRNWWRPGVKSHVWLQARLDRRLGSTSRDLRSELKSAGFHRELILANLRRMARLVAQMSWDPAGTEWADYSTFHNYSDADHQRKEEFVSACAARSGAGTVWDIGCNTGQFSRLAAQHGGQVIAMDVDPGAVETLYRSLKAEGPDNILPLVQNVADPSPAWGWRNRERTPLTERSRPDLVMCLALLHHVVITANVPLAEFVEWLAELAPRLIIEFVSPGDAKVEALLRNKEDIYSDYSRDRLEAELERHYSVDDTLTLDSGLRHLYCCVAR